MCKELTFFLSTPPKIATGGMCACAKARATTGTALVKHKDFLTCANKSEELERNPCICQKKAVTLHRKVYEYEKISYFYYGSNDISGCKLPEGRGR